MSTKKPYDAFGARLAEARIRAGIPKQGDLAKQIGTSQQSVSRWEAGTSRPNLEQITKIAAVVNVHADELAELAAYAPRQTVTFDRPFPFENLSPESFERFTADLVQGLFPGAEVYRAGGQGHTQAGIDVTAILVDGRKFTLQCKQAAEFGPKKVTLAIEADTTASDQKFLVLSRVASPDARAVIEEASGWTLWDRDDLSRKIRQLPLEDQRRLVRIYFANQYEALLGVPAGGHWETVDEFFSPFLAGDKLFTHAWDLVGREQLVEDISKALISADVDIVLMAGAGGNGKTRILKTLLDRFAASHATTKIRVASATMEITKASLDELGPGELLLVVDDAHDRADLQAVFAFVASRTARTKLVLAARPYGVDHIRAQASNYSFADPERFPRFDIPSLSVADAENLARQVLERLNGPVEMARPVAEFTYDCTLATVVGARIVAEEGIHPALMQSEHRFRQTLFGRFEDIVAGHLANREDGNHIRKVLGFLALMQPVAIDDRILLSAVESVENISVEETSRILKLLVEAGVLFRRGPKFRLSPDILGDYLIEGHFEGPNGRSNGLAERYFDAVPPRYIDNLLLNMGRIDWRRTGKTNDSPLLDGIWAKLHPTSEYSDPHLKAVEAVAYYQPARALAFVERLIRERRFISQLSDIAKYAGYTEEHFHRSLECLWEMGRVDARDLGSHPSHPVRVLKELAEPSPGKPLWVLDGVVEFAITKAQSPNVWSASYTPFDVMAGALRAEDFTSVHSKHQWSMTPYFVDPDTVADIRGKVIEALLASLDSDIERRALGAATTLADALRRPIGLLGAHPDAILLKKWDAHIVKTLKRLRQVLDSQPISPTVQAALGRVIAYHEAHGQRAVRTAAQAVRETLSSDLTARFERLLTDGYGHEDMRLGSIDDHDKRWNAFIDQTLSEMIATYSNAVDLLAFIEKRVLQADVNRQSTTAEVPVGRLIEQMDGFAAAVIDGVVFGKVKRLSRFTGHALSKIFRDSPDVARAHIAEFLDSGRQELKIAVASAYDARSAHDTERLGITDIANIERLLADEDEAVLVVTLRAVRWLSEFNRELALKLLRKANIQSANVANEFAAAFTFGKHIPIAVLTQEDIERLLKSLEPLPELEGYWLDQLLAEISEIYPRPLASFFMRRVESASVSSSERIRPCNYGAWRNQPLRFKKSPDGAMVMQEIAAWIRENRSRKGLFTYHARHLFHAMFAPFDTEVVAFLSDWLATAEEKDIETIAMILREADRDFVFRHEAFTVSLMDRAQQFGPETMRMVGAELFGSAVSGVKSGTSGQPFPQDISLKEQAQAVLTRLSRFSAAFGLYEGLYQHAAGEIDRIMANLEDDE
ncbi:MULTISPECIES: helix-turn-helix domain-containing protein [unclassified Neorhizobium]|uniref:helix-turn-helix domain-containing protein n=1 Tax=unclassified Neorhizobium TaxID=2629175 RepID=UPI001FF4A36A|nr:MULTISPECIES: helix-turn-helix domain-containing protein [unclassified Neorhizobium]MCJ9668532.1 helix-turn-helix domain-containing protein [Neorhizobium sp. SHOUNA12B]MCJ9744235.1 helix-turn-helix domain-containing protein [Neorhizobium sp. SHOUNA12A]